MDVSHPHPQPAEAAAAHAAAGPEMDANTSGSADARDPDLTGIPGIETMDDISGALDRLAAGDAADAPETADEIANALAQHIERE